MHAARPKNLTSRTAVDVSHPIIGKSLITKDRVVMSAMGFYPSVSHVRGDPARLTGYVVSYFIPHRKRDGRKLVRDTTRG
jgi:hypothetical protein